jgi:hypothetical protein
VIKKEIDNSVAAKGKRFLKAISVGGVENGIYFKRNKQYFSLVTGCISMIGAVVILTAAFKIYYDICTEKVINSTVEYPKNDVVAYKVPFMSFYHRTNLYFQVIAKDFWNDISYQITCDQLDIKMIYRLGT